MLEEREPEAARLQTARDAVQSFLVKKKRSTQILFYAAIFAEAVFLLMMLVFMDFHSRLNWFLFAGFLFIYSPLILFSWHNAVKIDHVYYRLVDELKYGGRDKP